MDAHKLLRKMRKSVNETRKNMATVAVQMRENERSMARAVLGPGATHGDWSWDVRRDVTKACGKNRLLQYLLLFGYRRIRPNLYRYEAETVNAYPDVRISDGMLLEDALPIDLFNHIYLQYVHQKRQASKIKAKASRARDSIESTQRQLEEVRRRRQEMQEQRQALADSAL